MDTCFGPAEDRDSLGIKYLEPHTNRRSARTEKRSLTYKINEKI